MFEPELNDITQIIEFCRKQSIYNKKNNEFKEEKTEKLSDYHASIALRIFQRLHHSERHKLQFLAHVSLHQAILRRTYHHSHNDIFLFQQNEEEISNFLQWQREKKHRQKEGIERHDKKTLRISVPYRDRSFCHVSIHPTKREYAKK